MYKFKNLLEMFRKINKSLPYCKILLALKNKYRGIYTSCLFKADFATIYIILDLTKLWTTNGTDRNIHTFISR